VRGGYNAGLIRDRWLAGVGRVGGREGTDRRKRNGAHKSEGPLLAHAALDPTAHRRWIFSEK